MTTNVINDRTHETALILANLGELTAAVIKKVAGNEISTALNGSPLTRELIELQTFSSLEATLNKPAA